MLVVGRCLARVSCLAPLRASGSSVGFRRRVVLRTDSRRAFRAKLRWVSLRFGRFDEAYNPRLRCARMRFGWQLQHVGSVGFGAQPAGVGLAFASSGITAG